MKTHPHISVLHALYLSENQPFRKVHRMIDLFESIDEWLHEIEDEDDKEDILGWAEKVGSGKMTEEKFAERVRGK
ncbi:MAG: hypothetical protein ACKODJ_02375 [Bacteroidota bacterium]